MRRSLLPIAWLAAPAIALAGPITPSALKVTSTAFVANGAIPREFSCDGTGTAPPLAWSGVPSEAKSVAIVVEDPDTGHGTFTHWLITGIKPSVTALTADDGPPDGAISASNDDGSAGYTGPCPFSGRHHYIFRVFALNTAVDGAASETREAFFAATKGHIVAQGELIGTYEKRTR